MKKTLIYALALALALSLTACGQPKAEQPTDPAPGTSTQEPIATPEPIKDTQPPEETDPQEDGQTLEEISHEELLVVFEQEYEISKEINNSDSEETIQNELEMIRITVECMEKSLPSDYEVQYREWRPSASSQNSEVTLTFTDCNETVWATGTVNIRSGPSTDDDKVGSLNKNQSATRIGVGTGDYSSWSKVKMSDGSEVYAASNYLTTTKPSTSSSQGGEHTQTPPQQGSQQGGDQQQQYDSSVDRGTSQQPSYVEVITDSSQISTGTSNPYSGYGEVSIGYGG